MAVLINSFTLSRPYGLHPQSVLPSCDDILMIDGVLGTARPVNAFLHGQGAEYPTRG
jgi:hypothetical protein